MRPAQKNTSAKSPGPTVGATVRPTEGPSLRADKWLWFARFFKSRSLAAKMISARRLRVSGQLVDKAHFQVRLGDVLTFPQGNAIRVVRILDLGSRRGPASEARTLYDDLRPPPSADERRRAQRGLSATGTTTDGPLPVAMREPGSGRPTKRQRRQLERFRDRADGDVSEDGDR